MERSEQNLYADSVQFGYSHVWLHYACALTSDLIFCIILMVHPLFLLSASLPGYSSFKAHLRRFQVFLCLCITFVFYVLLCSAVLPAELTYFQASFFFNFFLVYLSFIFLSLCSRCVLYTALIRRHWSINVTVEKICLKTKQKTK